MSKCPQCNNEWPDGQKFCGDCGAALEAAARVTVKRERRYVTVLFADIVSYSRYAHGYDVSHLHKDLEAIYGFMASKVEAHGGTVVSFFGDSIMAVFGAPTARENDEASAVRAALELAGEATKYNLRNEPVQLSIGLNAGLVLAGGIGAGGKIDFDILGDAVNLASRLQGAAGAGEILASETVYRRAGPLFNWESLDSMSLKNIPEPVPAYRVIGKREDDEARRYHGGGLAPLCGRDSEIGRIADLLGAVAEGRGQVLAMHGPGGIGKSRIVYELRHLAASLDFRVVETYTLPYGRLHAHFPLRNAVRVFAGLREDEAAESAPQKIRDAFSDFWKESEIREIRVSTLAWFLGYPFEEALIDKLQGAAKQDLLEVTLNEFFLALTDAPAGEEAAADSPFAGVDEGSKPVRKIRLTGVLNAKDVRARVEAAMERRRASRGHIPLCLVIEDMQWADVSTLNWLLQFCRLIKDKPIIILITYRPGFEHDWSSEPLVTYSEIELSPIQPEAVREMTRSALLAESIPEGLEDLIVRRSEGNPFFAQEIIRLLLGERILVRRGMKMELTMPLAALETRVPLSVVQVIQARIDGLGMDDRRTLQEASVIGRRFFDAVLERVTSQPGTLRESQERLTDSDFIHVFTRVPELEWEFQHVLMRDTAYETLDFPERESLHRMIAEAAEELYADRLEDFYAFLAHNFVLAGDRERAVHYLFREGKRLLRVGNISAAATALRDAFEMADEEHGDYLEIMFERAEVALQVESPSAAETILSRLPAELSPAQAARRLIVEGNILEQQGMYEEALDKLEAGRVKAESGGDSKLFRKAIRGMGVVQWTQGNLEEAEMHFKSCLKSALADSSKIAEAMALGNLGNVGLNRGNLGDALNYHEQALGIFQNLGNKQGEGVAYCSIGMVYHSRGEFTRAREFYEKFIEISRAIGDRKAEATALNNLGAIYHHQGKLDRAFKCFDDYLKLSRTIGYLRGEAIALTNIGSVCMDRGDFNGAVEFYEVAFNLNERLGAKREQAMVQGNLGMAYFFRGESDRSREQILSAMELAEDIGASDLVAENRIKLAELEADEGEFDKTTALFEKAVDAFEAHGRQGQLFSAYVLFADLSIAAGNAEQADAALEKAELLFGEVDDSPSLRDYHLGKAVFLSMQGKPDEALAAFKGALKEAESCAGPTNAKLYFEYGKFLAESRSELQEARKYLEKAHEIYQFRVDHGGGRKELEEITLLLNANQ
ncbi:MAG: tetratricopeptide repeat protein [Planctomycetota bacterium]|nr:MAG: tetratricopeptide repeat protein [Planctomycetota bacterium]